MPRTLIAYSTIDGQTRKISNRLKRWLEQHGHVVTLHEIGTDSAAFDSASFEQIVIGASIRYGKCRPDVYTFINTHLPTLEQKPNAFFLVNVVARKPGKDTPEGNPYFKAFLRQTCWRPQKSAVFAGKLDYPNYSFFDRQIIRLIMLLTKGPTDPQAVIEFTNWDTVAHFAQQLAMNGDLSGTEHHQ